MAIHEVIRMIKMAIGSEDEWKINMIEIYPQLHVGSESDYELIVRYCNDWRVVHACKDPYHRQALSYQGKAAPKNHPEYLFARRDHRLILNLVDAPNPDYIPKPIIDEAISFIHESVKSGTNVLVHCNQGQSRGPSIALIYLLAFTDRLPTGSLEEAFREFAGIYPRYLPAGGIAGFIRNHFEHYAMLNRST